MDWTPGDIDGVVITPLKQHSDPRGWLGELFRSDETPAELMPAMAYVSMTYPGVTRGPHEHVDQTDTFGFVGPGTFRLKLWDARRDSPTYGYCLTVDAGAGNPAIAVVPPGVVHGYRNVSDENGLVLNFPNRLYAGRQRREPVDEIRHEDEPDGAFRMDD